MRKLLMLAVGALAALAVSAPSALADVVVPVPHGDSGLEDWSAVTVADPVAGQPCSWSGVCFFEGADPGEKPWWAWKQASWPGGAGGACTGDLEGGISEDGSLIIGTVSLEPYYTSGSEYYGYSWLCDVVAPAPSYGAGLICSHNETGEVWVDTYLNLGGNGSGSSYAKLTGASQGSYDTLTFGDPSPGGYYTQSSSGYSHFLELPLGAEVEIEPNLESPECGWSSLS